MVTACASCAGRCDIRDLEDLCTAAEGSVDLRLTGCMGRCNMGPNVAIRGFGVRSRVDSFAKLASLVQQASGDAISEAALARLQLRSKGGRMLEAARGRGGDVGAFASAEEALTEAIVAEEAEVRLLDSSDSELDYSANPDPGRELRGLRMLRAESRRAMTQYDGALADFDSVLQSCPLFAEAHLQKAACLARSGRTLDAVATYHDALSLPPPPPPPPRRRGEHCVPQPPPSGLRTNERLFVTRCLRRLQQRLAEEEEQCAEAAAVGIPAKGASIRASAGDGGGNPNHDSNCSNSGDNSGDGSGWWRVTNIRGLSWDTCAYRLETLPPATPHPHPHAAWHVSVRVGATARDYTPTSTEKQWEEGLLELTVKSYPDGVVSGGGFATLGSEAAVGRGAGAQARTRRREDVRTELFITAPRVTLFLPGLTTDPPRIESAVVPAASTDSGSADDGAGSRSGPPPLQPQLTSVVQQLGIVVGGTGVAPALQLLREVADLSGDGAFGRSATAALLYSSTFPDGVVLLDELRALEAAAGGRITVRHTLTDAGAADRAAAAASAAASEAAASGRSPSWAYKYRPCSRTLELVDDDDDAAMHRHFLSSPLEPADGPLRCAAGEAEAGLRGRATREMLAATMPPPAAGRTKVVVCGPPQMWEDVSAMLLGLGHLESDLVELKALSSDQQIDPRAGGAHSE